MEAVRSVGQQIYVDPDGAAAKIGQAIVNAGADGQTLANAVTEHPERFGELRGKTGFFGDSKERKAAHHSSKALGLHVASAANTWSRRLEAERQSETWQRQNRDVVEVPSLTRRSEDILKQFDALPQAEKPRFLTELSGTPEGRQVREETKTVARALDQRLGSADPRSFKKELDRLGLKDPAVIERIKDVARLVDRTHRAELSRSYELTRGLKRGLGLGM